MDTLNNCRWRLTRQEILPKKEKRIFFSNISKVIHPATFLPQKILNFLKTNFLFFTRQRSFSRWVGLFKMLTSRNEGGTVIKHNMKPKTRADCKDGYRPCQWVSCRYHMAINIKERKSRRVLKPRVPNPPARPPKVEVRWDLPETCVLDIIDEHPEGMTFTEIAHYVGLTRQRVEQIQIEASRKTKGKYDDEHEDTEDA